MSLTVTVRDNETGDTAEQQVWDGDYFIVCAEPCHIDGIQGYPRKGTHVLTVKDVHPAKPPEPEKFTGQGTWPCVCGHAKNDHYFGDKLGRDGQMHTWCQHHPTYCIDFRPALVALVAP